MSLEAELQQIVQELLTDGQSQILRLERELLELQIRERDVKTHVDSVSQSLERGAKFPVDLGDDALCPICWIESDSKSVLRPNPSEDEREVFACRDCDLEITVDVASELRKLPSSKSGISAR